MVDLFLFKSMAFDHHNPFVRRFIDAMLSDDSRDLDELLSSWDKGAPAPRPLAEELILWREDRLRYEERAAAPEPSLAELTETAEQLELRLIDLALRIFGFIPRALVSERIRPFLSSKQRAAIETQDLPAPEPVIAQEREAAEALIVKEMPEPEEPAPSRQQGLELDTPEPEME